MRLSRGTHRDARHARWSGTSWHRGEYTFETCLHWLLGSKPGGNLHGFWEQVADIDKLTFIDPDEFVRIQTEDGVCLPIYTDADRLERTLLEHSPQDAAEIRGFTHAIRQLGDFRIPDPAGSWADILHSFLRNAGKLGLLRRFANISCSEYGRRFKDPLLRSFFGEGDMAQLSAVALVLSLGWMNARNAGYCIGGSQALIRLIAQKLTSLGGSIRCGARVERILVENNTAVGVQLADGEKIMADWVLSAADGHETIYDLLGGRYVNRFTKTMYDNMDTFPSYVQVSFGIGKDLSAQPGLVSRVLKTPFRLDPGTELRQVSFRIFHYDPTFAPAGKTAVTSVLNTRDFEYWAYLRQHDLRRYLSEKHRVAEAVMEILERMIPGVAEAMEVVDVSTPATVIRYTGNWKGSMEGWFLTPGMRFRPLPNRLPGLGRFLMAGQWIMPGGGLPSGLLTARAAIRAACVQDRVPFAVAAEADAHPVRHWRLRTP